MWIITPLPCHHSPIATGHLPHKVDVTFREKWVFTPTLLFFLTTPHPFTRFPQALTARRRPPCMQMTYSFTIGITAIVGIIAIISMHCLGQYYGIAVNNSPSAPSGLYFYTPLPVHIQPNAWVSFRIKESEKIRFHYTGIPYLLKKVCGLPNEYIVAVKKQIWVCPAHKPTEHRRLKIEKFIHFTHSMLLNTQLKEAFKWPLPVSLTHIFPTTMPQSFPALIQASLPCHPVGYCLSKGKDGQAIHCAFEGITRIPPQHYYLCSTRVPHSFDSRYLGLIARHRLLHKLIRGQ